MTSGQWRQDSWRREAAWWMTEQLAVHDIAATGPFEQTRVRPWSTVGTMPTDAGPVWFKAVAPGTAYEIPLLAALGRWCPDQVVGPLAVDLDRGWALLPDGGPTLRRADGGAADLAHWERLMVQYAELQRFLAPRATSLVTLGVPDLRPAAVPARRAALLADDDLVMLGAEGGMTADQRSALVQGAGRYVAWCAELDAIGVPVSLQHDDLHDANVFAPAAGSDRYRPFDWGDSSVAHPFSVLLVSMRVVSDLHHLGNGAAEVVRLRDAYIEPWTAEHATADLVRATVLACRVAGVSRADTYRRALLTADADERAEWGSGLPGWLLEDGDATPLEAEDPSGS